MTTKPESDYIELTPVEDSILHLNFLFDADGGRDIDVILTYSNAFGQ